jgi:thiol:disulfide interchange protein DsbD
MIARFTLCASMLCAAAAAEIRPGRAAVQWIAESPACQPGKPLKTAIRMVHDQGWHSYWINPGEAGIKTSAEWKMPPGWTNGGIRFPAPRRFLTSDLAGFGYEGTVLLPVTITPPADFTGTARLTAVVSWLACGEDGCVPGKTEVHLDLSAGDAKPSPDAGTIHNAHRKLPRPAVGFPRLSVTDKGKNLVLMIETESDATLDLDGREFFPANPDVIDPRVPIRFARNGGVWTTEVAKSEYAASPVRQLTLVLDPKEESDALELTWTAP